MQIQNSKKVLFFFATVFLFRLLFSSMVGLIDDDAYHWTWTKQLMLSYYDHPGMIAWLEAISTSIFGDTLFGVRLPSFICYALTAFFAHKLTKELFDEWAAHFVVFMFLFTPLWGFGGFIASPEPPFMLCWILACWVFWNGVREDNQQWSLKKTWLCLGVLMGLGLNSKFIIALLAPGFALYLILSPHRRRDLLKSWPWVGLVLATIIALPIFIWNHQYDWPGFRYQFNERHHDGGYSPQRWIAWFFTQMAFYSPVTYFLILLALAVAWSRRDKPQWRLIFSLALPSILVFYVQPLLADHKPHWAGAAHLLLTMGAGSLWSQGWQWQNRVLIKPFSQKIMIGVLLYLLPFTLIVYTSFLYPWMPKVYRLIKPQGQWNTTWDLSNEFHGWEELGHLMNERQREIHAQTGHRPFLAALRYETTAQAWWGTKQKVMMLNLTRSHYTVLHKFHHEWENLKGTDALIVTTEKYPADPANYADFDSCTSEEVKTYRQGEHSRTFTLWWCRNFHGTVK